jgi:hypothetical protein
MAASQESPTPQSYGGLHRRAALRTHRAHKPKTRALNNPGAKARN